MALLGAAVGCGTEKQDTKPEGGDVPITSRALAAVVVAHLGDASSAGRETDAAEEFAPDGVGAELRYPDSGDSDQVVVAVGKKLPANLMSCTNPSDYLAGCADVDGAIVFWEAAAPEEDPGVLYVTAQKEHGVALMFYSGPTLEDDPLHQNLPISVDDLVAIALDPRVDLTTSQAAIDDGENVADWLE